MKIIVCIKLYRGEINLFDASALECALKIDGAKVTVLAMAPLAAKQKFSALTRLGDIDAVLISDSIYAGSDTIATSLVLAEAIKKLSPDIILCGRQSADGDTGQVPPMLAARLDLPFFPYVTKFGIDKITTRNGQTAVQIPCVMSIERIAELRQPSLFSSVKEAEVWDNNKLRLSAEKVGLKGSPTRVVEQTPNRSGKRKCKFISPKDFGEILKCSPSGICVAPRALADSEKLKLVYYAGNIKNTANLLAERAVKLECDSPEEFAQKLCGEKFVVMLFESTPTYRVIASQTAAILEAGLTADCTKLKVEGGSLIMYRPALSGGIIAGIKCTSAVTMATVRPEGQEGGIYFCMGSGALSYEDKIIELSKKYRADLVCSRKAVEAANKPYEMQVGITGRTAAPRVYVALGVSGAMQHVASIEGSGTVIAVNKDKNAPIFEYADYGIVADIDEIE